MVPAPPGTRPMRRFGHAVAALALVVALAGCTPKAERAAQYDQLADQMASVGAWPAAVGTLQRALKLDANNADRWVRMGRAQRQLGQIAMAATSYQRALDLAPDNLEALQSISVLLVRGGQYDLAKTYVATLSVLAPDDIGGLLAQGAIALRERRLIDAEKAAQRIMTLAPSLSEGFILKARVLEERGQPRAAATLLTQRLKFDSKNSDLAVQVLRLDREIGDLAGVRDTALLLARIEPDDPRYQLEAARTLRARGQPAEAERTLAHVEQRWPANAQVLLGAAHERLDSEPRATAIGHIVALAQRAPSLPKAALADLLTRIGEAPAALDLLQPALGDKVTSDTVDVQGAYAAALLALGRTGDAFARATQVLDFDPHHPEALMVRAQIEGGRRNYQAALDDAQQVMAADAQNRDAALLVARLWAAQGNAVLADKAFGTAQDHFPNDLGIHQARIRWLLGQGRASDAATLATSFANQYGSREALTLMGDACVAAHDPSCAVEARRRLGKG